MIDRYAIQGSASVGIALYPEDGSSKDSLLSHADAAMYVAKNSSREF
jgi:GGDEF domain-containing protein